MPKSKCRFLANTLLPCRYTPSIPLSVEEFRDGFIKMKVSERVQPDFIMNLHTVLLSATGKKWEIDHRRGTLSETIAEKEKEEILEDKKNVSEIPLVKAILEEFRGAKIDSAVRKVINNEEDEEFLL